MNQKWWLILWWNSNYAGLKFCQECFSFIRNTWQCCLSLCSSYAFKIWPVDQNYFTGCIWTMVVCYHCRTPGRRCQVCYWCIIKDLRKRQHHHQHLEHKDSKSCRETLGTNTWNGQVQMEHPWTLWNGMIC